MLFQVGVLGPPGQQAPPPYPGPHPAGPPVIQQPTTPMFVAPPPKTQRLLHSEAYLNTLKDSVLSPAALASGTRLWQVRKGLSEEAFSKSMLYQSSLAAVDILSDKYPLFLYRHTLFYCTLPYYTSQILVFFTN